MTTPDMERLAAAVIPPAGATGWRLTIAGERDGKTLYAVVPVIDHRADGPAVFRGTPASANSWTLKVPA